MEAPKKIDCFDGEYRFLSNFSNDIVHFKGLLFLNSEAAFQAQKCVVEEDKRPFCDLQPGRAKRLGRKVMLRKDWEQVKDDSMYEVVRAKFLQHPALAQQLLDTRDAELIEGNNWGDTYWGVCNGYGKNKLGKILMRVRDELSTLTRQLFELKG
jgi:ribA/ribD-fused uncharacterized protein